MVMMVVHTTHRGAVVTAGAAMGASRSAVMSAGTWHIAFLLVFFFHNMDKR